MYANVCLRAHVSIVICSLSPQLERQLLEMGSQGAGGGVGGGSQLRTLVDRTEVKSLPLSRLEALRQHLRKDLEHLDSVSCVIPGNSVLPQLINLSLGVLWWYIYIIIIWILLIVCG